jgi:hypothetical protein
MRALGMSTTKGVLKSSDSTHARKMSHIVKKQSKTHAEADMTDEVYFDQWQRGTDYTSKPVMAEGFKLAAKRISKDFNEATRQKWLNHFK